MQLTESPGLAADVSRDRLAAAKVIGEAIRDLAGMRRRIERELVCDASIATLSVLSILERHGPVRVGEVAERVDVDLSVASRHTSALEQRGLVVRETSAGDRRAHVISVTVAGRATLAQARAWVAGRLDASLTDRPIERLTELADSLARLRADLTSLIPTSIPADADPRDPHHLDPAEPRSGDTTR